MSRNFPANHFKAVYDAARSTAFYRELYNGHPEVISDWTEFNALPTIDRRAFPRIKPEENAAEASARVYLTGGTGGITDAVEWYDDDLKGNLRPLLERISDTRLVKGDYAVSTVKSNQSLYGVTVDESCILYGLVNISAGSSSDASLNYLSNCFEDYPVAAVFTTPQGMKKILNAIRAEALAGIKVFVVAGAPLRKSLLRRVVGMLPEVEVIDLYGCTEANVIGVSCRHNDGFHISSENVIVDLINEDENGVGEVVITSLSNRRNPIVRYLNGDIGEFVADSCSCGSLLPRIRYFGRKRDCFFFGGTKFDSIQLETALDILNVESDYQCVARLSEGGGRNLFEVRLSQVVSIEGLRELILYEFQKINPALYAKLVAGEAGLNVVRIEQEGLLGLRGFKYPRFINEADFCDLITNE